MSTPEMVERPPQAFFDWWNSKWPDLAPTHQALHAWIAGSREAVSECAKEVERHRPYFKTEVCTLRKDNCYGPFN